MRESKKMVLKVDIAGDECKATRAMSTVAKFCGVKSMAVDGEKGTMTVVGAVDVVRVAKALRKASFDAHVLSVGPEKEEKKPDNPPAAKKPAEEPNKKPSPPLQPCCCPGCGGYGPPPCCQGGGPASVRRLPSPAPSCATRSRPRAAGVSSSDP